MFKLLGKRNILLVSSVLLLSGHYGLANATVSGQKLDEASSHHSDRLAQAKPNYQPIATSSNQSQISLAKYLSQKDIKFYGAWWCPHCHEQKEVFGEEAFKFVKYIECADAKNPRKQLKVCEQADIGSYPTWRMKGKTLTGVQSLKDLAKASGYKGSTDFNSP
jgi:hypothetical protein